MEQEMNKKGLIQWYDRNRWKIFIATFVLNVAVCILFAVANAVDLERGIILCQPEFEDYYENYQGERIASANVTAFVTVVISFIMLLISLKGFKKKEKPAVVIYNVALASQIYSLGRYVFIMLDVYKRIPYIGIFYVVVIIYIFFVLLLNVRHLGRYRETFTDVNDNGKVIVVSVILILGLVGISMLGTGVEKANIEKEKNIYAAKEFGKTYDVLWVEPGDSIEESPIGFSGLQYVNLFNDRGRTYSASEMEEAINNSYYYTGSWYSIKEFNEDCEKIEEKYDFRKYSIDQDPDNQKDYEIFYQLVNRRLRCNGMDPLDRDYITSEERYDACVHVHKLLSTEKTMDKIGSEGDVITITYDGNQNAGEKAVYTCSSDVENVYGVISKWNGVTKVGIDDNIDEHFPYKDEALAFEDGCIYRADIAIYPEITYYFDENVEVKLEGIDYEEIEYTVQKDCITVTVWFYAR